MISYWKCKDGFREIHQWKSGCWVKVSNPTAEELAVLKERFAVPDFTHDAEDIEERPRVDHENNWMLVFIRIPNRSLDEDGETMFTTAPMAVPDAVHIGVVPEVPQADEHDDERRRGAAGAEDGQ